MLFFVNLTQHVKLKTLMFEPKVAYLCTSRQGFDNSVAIFDISTFEFAKLRSFMLN